MKKWWIGAALAAMVVSQFARAQYPPDGGGPLPEPAPVAPAGGLGGQQFMPGPLPSTSAPPGPDAELSLPCDIPTAWGKGPPPDEGVYFSIGTTALMRQRPGRGDIAFIEGLPVQNTYQIDPAFNWGPQVTLGYLFDNSAIELTGFYLPNQQTSTSLVLPNSITVPFFNPPAPFNGNGNGIWNNAAVVKTELQYTLSDAELNYRWWSRTLTGLELLVGLRYMNLQERATVFVDDTDIGAIGVPPNLAFASTYMARVNNNLFLPQTGFDWVLPLRPWVSFGLLAKTGFGADDIQLTRRLISEAGAVADLGRSSRWTYSSLNDVNAYFDLVAWDKVRFRLGWEALWLLNVSEGLSQINYNLGVNSKPRDGGSIFYQGPRVEIEFLF